MKKLSFQLSSIYKDEIWVKANTVDNILRYKNTIKSVRNHVDPEDKRRLSELGPKSKHNETLPLERNEKNTIYVNESGLYSLIVRSKLESAQVFKRWVTKMYYHPLEGQENTVTMTRTISIMTV